MARLDKILEDIANDGDEKENRTPPAEVPPKDEQKDDGGQPEPKDEPQETPKDEPPKDTPKDTPSDEGTHDEPPKDEPQKKDIPDDKFQRAEFSFKRQLGKQKEKYEKELKDRDDKLDAMQKQIDEMKKAMNPPEPLKTREQFKDDEDFINYLTDQRVKAALAARDDEQAKKDAERAAQEAKAKAEQEELRERQDAWLNSVQNAFGGDKQRSDKFLERVAYANGHGFGQVLDACPVAADYLINDPMGPLVFEKILNDRAEFEKVFDPRRANPMGVYMELRRIEESVRNPQPNQDGQQQPKTVVPAMGRPGRQAGGSSLASTDMFDDPKALRKWLREHR